MSQPHRKRKLAVWIGSALAVACGALALLLIFGANRPRTVGGNIATEDITQFYYTLSSSTCPPHWQRYHFYTENGKYFFYHETRAGHAWPLTEENITRFGTVELSPEQWNTFVDCVKGGSVTRRTSDAESGDPGPWLYLYWTGDRGKIQQFAFASPEAQLSFESLCTMLCLA